MPRRLRISKLKALTMVAASGAYSWAGTSANLVWARHISMVALSGVFQWSGFNANLAYQTNLTAAATIGGNIATFEYYSLANLLVNMVQQSSSQGTRDWQTPAHVTLTADANGDPPQDFLVTPHYQGIAASNLDPNARDIPVALDCLGQFTGWADSITTDRSHVTILNKAYNSGTNTTTFTVHYAVSTNIDPGVHITFTGTRRTGGSTGSLGPGGLGTGVADLLIAHPGYTIADIANKVWTDEAVNFFRSCNGPLRTMDMQGINHSTNVNWSDVRRRATHKIGGPTYEDLYALANRTGLDLHMQIPHLFTDAAVQSFVDFFETNVSQARRIFLGFSNEHTFSAGFRQFHDLLVQMCIECKAFVGGETAASNSLGLDRSWTASRTANVVTVTTNTTPHLLTTNQTVYFTNFEGTNPTPTITVTSPTTFTFPNTGVDNPAISTSGSNTWFVGDLTSTARLGSTIALDSYVNIYGLKNRGSMRRTKEISDLVRGRVGDAKMHSRWFITWEDQMFGNSADEQFSDNPLRYLEAKWTARPVNQYVSGLFGAPYFNANPLTNTAGATQSQLANQLVANCGNAKTDYKFEERAAVADYYGFVLGSSWYEGGPDVRSGSLSGADLGVRCAVQFDPLLGTAYATMLGEFFALGGKIANQYTLGFLNATDQNRDLVWGVTNSLTNLTTAKLTAITSTIASGAQVTRNVVPGTVDARLFCNQFTATTYPNLTVPHRRFTINAKTAGLYRLRIRYTCNQTGKQANIIVGSTTVSGGPFTFTNQGTSVAHSTLRTSPGPIALPDMNVTLKQGVNGVDVVRTASMGDDIQLYDMDVRPVLVMTATSGTFGMTGQSATFTRSAASTLAQDWTARSTAAGVVKSVRFNSQTVVTNGTHQDGNQANIVWDSADGIMGDGCLRLNHPAAAAANAGAWRTALNSAWTTDGQGFGTADFYIQFRLKLGPNRLVPSVNGGGFKFCNLSEYLFSSPNSSRSHSGNEIVMNNQNWYGIPEAYRETDDTGTTLFGDPDGGGGKLQNAIDNGSGISDPNLRYCMYQSGTASAGCWFFKEGEWITVQVRIKQAVAGGTIGTGNIFQMWVARDGETSFTQLYDIHDVRFGSDSLLPNGVNGIWFLTYDTNRTSATYDTWQKIDQLIVSTQPIACPQVGTKPTWLSTLTSTFTGKQLVGSNVSTAQTYTAPAGLPKAELFSYSGATSDRRAMYFMGGGHADYAGNEVLKLDLSLNTPITSVLRAPTQVVTGDVPYYSDGRPVSRHSCWNIQHIEARSRIFFPGAPATYINANLQNKMDAFRLDTNDYDPANTWTTSGFSPTNVGSGICKDGQDNILYWDSDNGPLYQWSRASATWSRITKSNGFDFSSSNYAIPIAYDPYRNRVVRFSNTFGSFIDLTARTETAITTPFASLPSSGCSAIWCPDLKCFLVLPWYTRTVYRVDPVTYAVTTLSLSNWTAPFINDGNGKGWILGRFAYLADYGVVLYVNRTGDDAWVFRTR